MVNDRRLCQIRNISRLLTRSSTLSCSTHPLVSILAFSFASLSTLRATCFFQIYLTIESSPLSRSNLPFQCMRYANPKPTKWLLRSGDPNDSRNHYLHLKSLRDILTASWSPLKRSLSPSVGSTASFLLFTLIYAAKMTSPASSTSSPMWIQTLYHSFTLFLILHLHLVLSTPLSFFGI